MKKTTASLLGRARDAAFTFAGKCGVRLDRLAPTPVLLALASIVGALVVLAVRSLPLTVLHITFGWTAYFVGNAVILGTGVRAWMIRRFGEARAWRHYQTIASVMFLNVSFALGDFCILTDRRFFVPVPLGFAVPLGVALLAVGLVVKTWATMLVGLDVYYWKDMFLARPVGPFVTRGPYRWLRNPMYGVGWLHSYGVAVLYRSWLGLLAVAFFHASIYTFHLLLERPFVARTYGRVVAEPAPEPVVQTRPV